MGEIHTIDFETYYDTNYSLSKMQTDEYILDPRFEILLVGVDDDTFSGTLEETREFILEKTNPEEDTFIAHHAAFDGFILSQRLGIKPKMWVDTLSMARAALPFLEKFGLAYLAKHFGLPDKQYHVLNEFKGRRRDTLSPQDIAKLADYCKHDVWLARKLYDIFLRTTPPEELWTIDMTIRMFTEPSIGLDADLLWEIYQAEVARKERLLEESGLSKKDLMSNPKFAALLRAQGIDPPMKVSPTTGADTFAFAKSDKAFTALLEDDNPVVQALVATRLGVKSTIAETRALRLYETARRGTGLLPVMLSYWGARTTGRMAGTNGINCMHPDIEVLSRKGWVRIEDWQPEQGIMQWWRSGEVSWCNTATKVFRDSSELVWFDAPFVRGGFTKDHRFVHQGRSGFVDKTAEWISEHSGLDDIPLAGLLEQDGLLSPEQVRVLVAVAADGTIKKHVNSRALIFGFRKERKIHRIQSLLGAAGIGFSVRDYEEQTRIYSSRIPAWITKGFGPWVLSLSSAAMDALLEEVVHWDGGPHSRTNNTVFYTTILAQAQWVATVAHLRGVAASIYTYDSARLKTEKIHHVYFRGRPFSSIDKKHVAILPYAGKTYCPSVDSSYVLARYDNRIFVTGQCQNIPGRGPTARLRNALTAPPGSMIVVGDSANIELRVAMACAGETEALKKLAAGIDLYIDFASQIFSCTPAEVTKSMRFLGKVAMLSLQYGVGPDKFMNTVRLLMDKEHHIDLDEAKRIVRLYRETYTKVVALWQHCGTVVLKAIRDKEHVPVDVNGWFSTRETGFAHGDLPGVVYDNIQKDQMTGEWSYSKGKLYGGKVVENLCQHMARHVVMWQTVAVHKKFPVGLSVHDEIVCIVAEDQVKACVEYMNAALRLAPQWCRRLLPLSAEVYVGKDYGSCKK